MAIKGMPTLTLLVLYCLVTWTEGAGLLMFPNEVFSRSSKFFRVPNEDAGKTLEDISKDLSDEGNFMAEVEKFGGNLKSLFPTQSRKIIGSVTITRNNGKGSIAKVKHIMHPFLNVGKDERSFEISAGVKRGDTVIRESKTDGHILEDSHGKDDFGHDKGNEEDVKEYDDVAVVDDEEDPDGERTPNKNGCVKMGLNDGTNKRPFEICVGIVYADIENGESKTDGHIVEESHQSDDIAHEESNVDDNKQNDDKDVEVDVDKGDDDKDHDGEHTPEKYNHGGAIMDMKQVINMKYPIFYILIGSPDFAEKIPFLPSVPNSSMSVKKDLKSGVRG